MRIKLNKINNIDKNDLLKRVEYVYSIEDSSGLLKIEQTLYNNINELEYFIKDIIPNLYKFDKKILYTVYHKNFKYTVYPDGRLEKFRMY